MRTPSCFVEGECYHVYNRGVDRRVIFNDEQDLDRFILSMQMFNSVEPIGSIYELGGRTAKSAGEVDPLVNIVCYCLNPNHYHLILQPNVDGGVSEFMKRLNGGYAWYFNNKHKRGGALFQGKFKAKHVATNEYLLRLSAYVNLNDKAHRLDELRSENRDLVKSRSSWGEYVDANNQAKPLCEKEMIIGQFKSKNAYQQFALEAFEQTLERKAQMRELENLLLE